MDVVYVTDMAARLSALLSGQVDAIDLVDTRFADRISKVAGFRIVRSKGKAHYTIPRLNDMAPTDDHHVRMALKHAIDRKQMIDIVLQGFGEIGNDHPIPSTDPFHNSELPQRPYDPEKAKYHLGKAGLSSLKVELSVSEAALNRSTDIGALFKESAKPAGIDMDLKLYPGDGFWSDVWQKKPLVVDYWFGRPTPGMMFATAYQSGVPWNESPLVERTLRQPASGRPCGVGRGQAARVLLGMPTDSLRRGRRYRPYVRRHLGRRQRQGQGTRTTRICRVQRQPDRRNRMVCVIGI